MAKFTRRKSGKRRWGRRKFVRRKRNGNFKRRVKRVVLQLAEHKYIEGNSYVGNCTNLGYLQIFPVPSQGTSSNTRLGDEIRVRSLKLNAFMVNGTDDNLSYIRVIFGCWNDYYGTSPTQTKILNNVPDAINSYYVRDYLEARSWTPMYDRRFLMGKAGSGENIPSGRLLTMNFYGKKLPKKRMVFKAGTQDHAYFMLITTGNAFGIDPPSIIYDWRMTFTDM